MLSTARAQSQAVGKWGGNKKQVDFQAPSRMSQISEKNPRTPKHKACTIHARTHCRCWFWYWGPCQVSPGAPALPYRQEEDSSRSDPVPSKLHCPHGETLPIMQRNNVVSWKPVCHLFAKIRPSIYCGLSSVMSRTSSKHCWQAPRQTWLWVLKTSTHFQSLQQWLTVMRTPPRLYLSNWPVKKQTINASDSFSLNLAETLGSRNRAGLPKNRQRNNNIPDHGLENTGPVKSPIPDAVFNWFLTRPTRTCVGPS